MIATRSTPVSYEDEASRYGVCAVYGPRMRPNMAISYFVSRCLHDEPPVIYGDSTQTRDFTYVDDILWANEQLLETDVADGKIINVGSTDYL